MKTLLAIATFPLLLGAASDAVSSADMRCFLVVGELAGNKNPQIQTVGLLGTQFWLGRIDAQSSALSNEELGRLLLREAEAIKPADKPGLMQSCGARMQETGTRFQAIGKQMQDQARGGSRL